MSTLRLALIQMQSKADARDENVAKACRYIDEVAGEKPDLIVLPEFFNHEYVFQYRDYAHIDCAEPESGHTITRDAGEGEGAPDDDLRDDLRGAGAGPLLRHRLLHRARRRDLRQVPQDASGGRPEPREDLLPRRNPLPGREREAASGSVSVICYDHCFPETARCATVNGAELILGPFAAPRFPTWDQLMITRAWENGVYMAPCNKVGLEGDWVFGGRSLDRRPVRRDRRAGERRRATTRSSPSSTGSGSTRPGAGGRCYATAARRCTAR